MAEYFNSRIQLKKDTSANWTAQNPVILDGEVIIVKTESGAIRTKTGDGVKRYKELPFDDESVLNAIATRLAISQGVENAHKILAVGIDGNIVPSPSITWGQLSGSM